MFISLSEAAPYDGRHELHAAQDQDMMDTLDSAILRPELAAAVLNTTAALIVVLDTAGRVVQFNPACEQLTGYAAHEVRGQLLWPFVMDQEERERAAEIFRNLRPGMASARYENRWQSRDGAVHDILWSITELHTEAGNLDLIVATGMNVTEERRAQVAQAESDERFRTLFERSADGVVLADPHDPAVPWRILDCNETFAAMHGYPRNDLIGMSMDQLLVHGLAGRRGEILLGRIRTRQVLTRPEADHHHRSGTVFQVESAASLVTTGGRELVLSIDRDVTEHRRAEASLQQLNDRLSHEAQHDHLTGLPNRSLLMDRLEVELARATRSGKGVAVMFVDLDDFKRVNDTLGHEAGDALLREVATRLQGSLRPSDTLARVGGDEFVILVPDLLSEHHAARVARRLQAALVTPVKAGQLAVTVDCSVGISLSPQDGVSAADLIRHADLAMYQMKGQGKNGVQFYAPALNEAAQHRLHMELRLRQAIASESLTLHYQPQVDAHTGALVGIEALARWTDVELGVVSPADFIPVAEDTRLILPMGAWVLDEACRQAAEWQLRVPMAVNISPQQLVHPDFPALVRTVLLRHGRPPSLLTLELTERLAIRDPQLAATQLMKLRQLGVQLSLDDFGAGQSALASLLTLPLSEVKFDRSLLTGVTSDPESWKVLGALLALARSLNLPVVAEGVETPEQLDVLRQLGCERVQGYLTGRPDSPAALTQLHPMA